MSRYVFREEEPSETHVSTAVQGHRGWNIMNCFSKKKSSGSCSEVHIPSQCTSLSEAVHRASRNKIRRISIASGSYVMEENVFINVSNLIIKGAGIDSTCLHYMGYHGKIQLNSGCQNVIIEGIHLCCEGSGNGIEILNKSSVDLKNMKISGGGFGVYANKMSTVNIYDSVICGNTCPGICVEDSGTMCNVYNTKIINNDSNGCFANRMGRITMYNSTVLQNKEANYSTCDNGIITNKSSFRLVYRKYQWGITRVATD